MANAVGLRWAATVGSWGHDIHLLPGQRSPRLDKMLVLDLDDGNAIFADQAIGANKPTFQAGCIGSQFITGVSGAGSSTGELDVDRYLPSPRVHNFLIHANVTLTDRVLKHRIRVHVHGSVRKLWLTPSSLHVPQGAKGYGFTVLAEFDDGVVGDITYWPGLTWSSNPSTSVSFQAGTSLLDAKSPGTATIEVKYGQETASATVIVGPAWSARTVEYMGGAGKAGAFQDGKTNILFIPEGFTDAEKEAFQAYVLDLVRRLGTLHFTRPFDLLHRSIRYWLAWVSSAEQGIGVLPEMTLDSIGDEEKCKGKAVPQPQEPPPGATQWTLEQLIHEVGLPVPADKSRTSAQKILEWTRLFGAKAYWNVTESLFTSWLALADRRLADERDTAFGLALGERPRAEQRNPPRALTMHPRRASPEDLRQFLSMLTYRDPAQPIGAAWTAGADKGLVCFVGRSERHGGAQSPTSSPYFATTVDEQLYVRLQPVQNSRRVHIVPTKFDLKTKAKRIIVITVAHECAHALGLGDEYGDGQGTEFPASRLRSLLQIGNLQGRLEGDSLVVDKWLWPRIAKAGVLKDAPEYVSPSTVKVTLMEGHGRLFRKAMLVLLRRRRLPWDNDQRLLYGPLQTGSLIITKIDGDEVTLSHDSRERLDFSAKDLLIQPVLDAAKNPLTLVAPKILDHIKDTEEPLWAHTPPIAPPSVTRPTNLPGGEGFWVDRRHGGDGKKMPRMRAGLVGLYEGGGTYDRGVYRPAGICLMRGLWEDYFGLYPFCPVCRYFIVDRIDPTRHGDLDDEYADEYPEP